MKRIWLSGIALALCGSAFAQGAMAIYSAGRTIKDQGISVKGWGSGTISETDEAAFEGNTSIRISTRNYFQGGRMVLTTPTDLSKAFADKNNLLIFALKIPDASDKMGGGAPGGGRGNPSTSGGGGGTAGERGGRGGGRGGGLAGGESGGQGAGKEQKIDLAALQNIRVIFTTTDGKKSEAYIATGTSAPGARGWKSVGIPLQAIGGFDRTNKIIKEIAIAGDATASFYVGEIKIINDATPIYGEPNVRELNLGLGQEVTFIGSGQGGSSVLKYTWVFKDEKGNWSDAEGQVVKRKFRTPGVWTVTMTISDAYGLKQPYSTPIKITVNP